MDGTGGCTSLGIGTRGGKSARYGTWNVVKGKDVQIELKANDPPDDAFKTLIKRTPVLGRTTPKQASVLSTAAWLLVAVDPSRPHRVFRARTGIVSVATSVRRVRPCLCASKRATAGSGQRRVGQSVVPRHNGVVGGKAAGGRFLALAYPKTVSLLTLQQNKNRSRVHHTVLHLPPARSSRPHPAHRPAHPTRPAHPAHPHPPPTAAVAPFTLSEVSSFLLHLLYCLAWDSINAQYHVRLLPFPASDSHAPPF